MSVVEVGVGIPQKLSFLVNNAVQTLCPGFQDLDGLLSSSPELLFGLGMKKCEWLTFVRQDPQRSISSRSVASVGNL